MGKTSALSCYPLSAPHDATIGAYCPTPPVLSLTDTYNTSISGPLDTHSTFIAEYLLGVADKLEPSVFFHEVQAGFVVSYLEPPLSFCRLPDSEDTLKFSALLSILYNQSQFDFNNLTCINYLDMCLEDLELEEIPDPNKDIFKYCKKALDLRGCVDSAVSNVSTLPGDFYTSLPYDLQYLIQNPACNDYTGTPSVARVYPDQENIMTVTIWYNNQVRTFFYITCVIATEKFMLESTPLQVVLCANVWG